MIKQIKLKNKSITYNLQIKPVKNINLRIKGDGTVNVSANCYVSETAIEAFILSKADLILKTLYKIESREEFAPAEYYSQAELCRIIVDICERVYTHFKSRGVEYPAIRFRRMVSQWGNCHARRGIVTFNTNLVYAPLECIEYVVVHEFTHFLQPNHSDKFYAELSEIMPDWSIRRQKLKQIYIPRN